MYKKKFKIGERFSSFNAFIEWINNNKYVMWHDRPVHPGWAKSWQIQMAFNAVESGTIRKSKEIKK